MAGCLEQQVGLLAARSARRCRFAVLEAGIPTHFAPGRSSTRRRWSRNRHEPDACRQIGRRPRSYRLSSVGRPPPTDSPPPSARQAPAARPGLAAGERERRRAPRGMCRPAGSPVPRRRAPSARRESSCGATWHRPTLGPPSEGRGPERFRATGRSARSRSAARARRRPRPAGSARRSCRSCPGGCGGSRSAPTDRSRCRSRRSREALLR